MVTTLPAEVECLGVVLFVFSLNGFIHFSNYLGLSNFSVLVMGFPGGSDSKESACQCRRLGLICGLGRPLEEEMVPYSNILAWRTPWAE